MRHLLARKSVEMLRGEMEGESRLHRVLGPIGLTSLGVGAIIGAGIFVMTGRAAAVDAGPAIMVSFLVAALGCAMAALCYAEFAALIPVAGSTYTYAYATLGELLAWIIGWDLVLEYAMACATVASAWAHYLDEFFASTIGWRIPAVLMSDPFTKIMVDGVEIQPWFNLPGMIIMAVVTGILILGIRESAVTNAILVGVKLAVVLLVIGVGWAYVNPSNWTSLPITQLPTEDAAEKWGILGLLGLNQWLLPVDDAVRSSFAPYGFSGIMLGASIVFFAYIGFDSISTHSEEARNPQRDVPLAILISLTLCTVLYIATSAVITGMEPYFAIDQEAAIAAAFNKRAAVENSSWLRFVAALISAGALAGMTSVLLVSFLSQVRIFLAMARDGLLPPIFSEVHPRFRTPHRSTLMTGAFVCVVTAITPITKLEQMVNIGTLMAFVIVCASVLMLRIQRPDLPRPFRCPAAFVIAPLGILVNFVMMLFLPWDTWLRLVVWLAIGLVLYRMYGFTHSKLRHALEAELKQGASPTNTPLA